ncbi:MAG: hypothetical protein GX558_10675, partial [Clostridiales bacterium]|nr:hypothetical protein [Clostridiales bacterium]
LKYMADKYHIIAACICKDQWGTDGYTMWGGYWNQGYYPSARNLFCPAQSREMQIDVPVFRMLGSDPVSQYDLGLSVEGGASECQRVASLEPVYGSSGADPDWVNWFVRQNFRGGSLAFAYAQAGQENSFGWPAMDRGLTYQFELFARLRRQGQLVVEPLGATGDWFRRSFDRTPATAVSALEPLGDRRDQSVWYDCADYRANLYNDRHGLRLRDLFLFDQARPERYLTAACQTEYLIYDNLPIIDGNRMSGGGVRSGGYVVRRAGDGWRRARAEGLRVREGDGLTATACVGGAAVQIELTERGLTLIGERLAIEWAYDPQRGGPTAIGGRDLQFEHQGWRYALHLTGGRIEGGPGLIRLISDGRMAIGFERRLD